MRWRASEWTGAIDFWVTPRAVRFLNARTPDADEFALLFQPVAYKRGNFRKATVKLIHF